MVIRNFTEKNHQADQKAEVLSVARDLYPLNQGIRLLLMPVKGTLHDIVTVDALSAKFNRDAKLCRLMWFFLETVLVLLRWSSSSSSLQKWIYLFQNWTAIAAVAVVFFSSSSEIAISVIFSTAWSR